MNGGPSGFNNAPVTRTLIIASALLTIFIGIQGRSTSLGLSYQGIFKKPELWSLIASVFAFSSTPEMMFGLYLLYYFRVFERQMGSNKYSVQWVLQGRSKCRSNCSVEGWYKQLNKVPLLSQSIVNGYIQLPFVDFTDLVGREGCQRGRREGFKIMNSCNWG